MKLKKSHVSIGFLILILSLSVVGAMNQSFNFHNKLETPKASDGEITIITPENKTYTGPDSGYYPATYGFENDEDGTVPEDWIEYKENPDHSVNVITDLGGHKKIVDMDKGNNNNQHDLFYYFEKKPEFGTVELWMRNSANAPLRPVRLDNEGYGAYNIVATLPSDANNNQWYHIKIQFECGTGNHYGLAQYSYRTFIDGLQTTETTFTHSNVSSVDFLSIPQHWTLSNYHTYIDAVSFDWDYNYIVGDNLNEGLLLSYDNSTNLDWKGYSLDGQANKTILGNATIPMPADGGHNIQVFGNDTMGTMYESDLRYFTVNTAPPDITINSPTDSQIIGSTAPNYDISITGPYDSMWYALEGGANYTAIGLTGTIDQSAWFALSDGIITIDFYANNSAGMEGTAQVQVFKQTSEEPPPTPPGIPGYDFYLLLGALSIISALLIRKRMKS